MSSSPAAAAEILSRAFSGDPERGWGSARPEWLKARAEGRLDPDGNIRGDDRGTAPEAAAKED